MIAGWLPFVTIGEIRRRARRLPYNEHLVDSLNALVDEQQALIESQRAQITAKDELLLEHKRQARDIAQIAVEAIDCPTPRVREILSEMAREYGYAVARAEEHQL